MAPPPSRIRPRRSFSAACKVQRAGLRRLGEQLQYVGEAEVFKAAVESHAQPTEPVAGHAVGRRDESARATGRG